MGGYSSKPDPAPAPAPAPESEYFVDEPWRKINWINQDDDLQYLNKYKPFTKGQQLRILIYGVAGAGKSSFINSVQNVLRRRMTIMALADNGTQYSFTKEYKSFKIQRGGPENCYPFVFNDIMGFDKNGGVLVDDLKLAFKGHVKDGYRFNPESKLLEGDQFYNKTPTDNDKVHILVCVVPADKFGIMTDQVKRKMREVRLEASQLGIPQVAILTKVDAAFPEVHEHLSNVYRSKRLKRMMEKLSADVGIPMNCIFAVKNYHEEIKLDYKVDSLILSALKNIINFADDYINMKLLNAPS